MGSSEQLFRACWPLSAEHTATSLSGITNAIYQERSICGSELMRIIHKALPLVCAADHALTFVVWSLGPSPLLLVKASTEPKPELTVLACGLDRGNEASKHP